MARSRKLPVLALAGTVLILLCFAQLTGSDDGGSGVFGDLEETSPEQQCDPAERQKMRAFFANIVLIIHFNYAWVARKSVGFWLRIYSDLFRHIVLISDEAAPELNIEVRSPVQWSRNWRMCYAYLPVFMARYPDADGFLWTNDDVVINYWNLLKANKTKLWLPNDRKDPDVRWFPFNMKDPSKWPSDWAGYTKSRITMNGAIKLLNSRQLRNYQRHARPLADYYPKRICDVYYIPRKFVPEFSALVPVCLKARVPSELCIPFVFYVLDFPKSFDQVLDSMIYRWDQWKSKITGDKQIGLRYFPQKFWKPEAPAFHPWKISRGDSQVVLMELLRAWDPCLK